MGHAWKTRKGDGAGVEKGAKRQKLQQTLGDSSAALLSAASPLLMAPTDKDMFGDLLRDEPMGLNPCNDLIDELLLVRKMTQVAPEASQCSAIVLPFVQALPIKKEQWTPCQEVRSFLKEDPHRPRQPLEIEMKNKAGMVVQKISSSICGSLLL